MANPEATQNLKALGPYAVQELLGYNEVTATFRGEDETTAVPVTLVAIHESDLSDSGAFEQVKAAMHPLVSAQASRLAHPFAAGQSAGHYWAAYEWLSGHHLGEYCRDNGLPDPVQSLIWMAELTEAISTLHHEGIVHRIISPASIFINSFNQVKLLHAAWSNAILLTNGGLISPPFMSILPFVSPEVARYDEEIDESADVYSVGSNLFFLLTGAPPHWRDDPDELMMAIQNEPVDLSGLEEMIGSEGIELMEELLNSDPEERPINLPALADRFRSLAGMIEQGGLPPAAPVDNDFDADATRLDVPMQNTYEPEPAPAHEPPGYTEPASGLPSDAGVSSYDRPPQDDESRRGLPPVGYGPVQPKTLKEAMEAQRAFIDEQEPDELPPPPAQSAEAPKKGPSKILVIGGIAGIVLLLLGGAAVAAIFLMGGEEEPELEPWQIRAEVTEKPEPVDMEKVMAGYDITVDRIMDLRRLMVGYEKQNGEWPKALSWLKGLGAKDEEFIDGWETEFDLRDAGSEIYIVSAGPDQNWESEDEIWIEVTEGVIGGYKPDLQSAQPQEP